MIEFYPQTGHVRVDCDASPMRSPATNAEAGRLVGIFEGDMRAIQAIDQVMPQRLNTPDDRVDAGDFARAHAREVRSWAQNNGELVGRLRTLKPMRA